MIDLAPSPPANAPARAPSSAPPRRAWPAALALLLLAACIELAYHDPWIYQRLCELKVECDDVLERGAKGPWSDELARSAHATRLGLHALVEYEIGKGSGNVESAKQARDIYALFADDLDEFAKGDVAGRLGPGYAAQSRQQLSEAFDKAIQTEAAKNEQKPQ